MKHDTSSALARWVLSLAALGLAACAEPPGPGQTLAADCALLHGDAACADGFFCSTATGERRFTYGLFGNKSAVLGKCNAMIKKGATCDRDTKCEKGTACQYGGVNGTGNSGVCQ